MTETLFLKLRLYFTGVVTLSIGGLLAWNFYHGGVPSHHILAREDLPEISNWWGGLLLPLLTWFLLYRTKKRAIANDGNTASSLLPMKIVYGFAGGLFFGITLSTFFTLGNTEVPGYMLMGLFFSALFLPVHRAECLLGFVLGMTFTFGAILPTGIGSILALISFVLYQYVRTAVLYVASKLAKFVFVGKKE